MRCCERFALRLPTPPGRGIDRWPPIECAGGERGTAHEVPATDDRLRRFRGSGARVPLGSSLCFRVPRTLHLVGPRFARSVRRIGGGRQSALWRGHRNRSTRILAAPLRSIESHLGRDGRRYVSGRLRTPDHPEFAKLVLGREFCPAVPARSPTGCDGRRNWNALAAGPSASSTPRRPILVGWRGADGSPVCQEVPIRERRRLRNIVCPGRIRRLRREYHTEPTTWTP